MSGPRRNSDGTVSFPSQNPYTDRRPGEPKMPRGMEWSMLSKDEKERLRGLAKEHAENIGLHILAAYSLEESDPEAALAHAKWVALQASRIDFSRETLAFIAYRQGDYKLALKEFRTAHRMNGYPDYLPFIADCERGLEEPKKAIELALSDEGKALQGEAKVEMFLVYAGALADLELWDKAIEVVHKLGRSNGLPGAYRMRALQAEQNFLEEAGRSEEAIDIDPLLDKLELQYADDDEDEESDDIVIDYDLEDLPEELMEQVGISWDDAQYAPEEEFDEDYNDERGDDDDHNTDAHDDVAVNDGSITDGTGANDIADEATNTVSLDGTADNVNELNADMEPVVQADADDEQQLPAQETEQGMDAAVAPSVMADDNAAQAEDTVELDGNTESESNVESGDAVESENTKKSEEAVEPEDTVENDDVAVDSAAVDSDTAEADAIATSSDETGAEVIGTETVATTQSESSQLDALQSDEAISEETSMETTGTDGTGTDGTGTDEAIDADAPSEDAVQETMQETAEDSSGEPSE
jgi:tetratricopeptide (TPR) repeat protein